MMKLRFGYFLSGIITGLILLIHYLIFLPDGRLKITVCDVGQGDSVYVQFPDGRDMLLDGGPGDRVLPCLGNHMPFWDKAIDIVVLTHPDSDHLNGLLSVLSRYQIGYLVRSDIRKDSEAFEKFQALVREKSIDERLVKKGEVISIGSVHLDVLSPSENQLALFHPTLSPSGAVLGAVSDEVNEASVVFRLSYGRFDALFPGDAEDILSAVALPPDGMWELIKVPHHGSALALSDDDFPRGLAGGEHSVAVISVGKNSFGHPVRGTIDLFERAGFSVFRTDEMGDIDIVFDGNKWEVRTDKTIVLTGYLH